MSLADQRTTDRKTDEGATHGSGDLLYRERTAKSRKACPCPGRPGFATQFLAMSKVESLCFTVMKQRPKGERESSEQVWGHVADRTGPHRISAKALQPSGEYILALVLIVALAGFFGATFVDKYLWCFTKEEIDRKGQKNNRRRRNALCVNPLLCGGRRGDRFLLTSLRRSTVVDQGQKLRQNGQGADSAGKMRA